VAPVWRSVKDVTGTSVGAAAAGPLLFLPELRTKAKPASPTTTAVRTLRMTTNFFCDLGPGSGAG